MSSLYKTFRITKDEDVQIRQFLKDNPLFDFSTLARAALQAFIENPRIKIKSVKATVAPKLRQQRLKHKKSGEAQL